MIIKHVPLFSQKLCPKVQHILQVWSAEQGVISLHCFQNVIPVEAYTREACMVEAIGEYKLHHCIFFQLQFRYLNLNIWCH